MLCRYEAGRRFFIRRGRWCRPSSLTSWLASTTPLSEGRNDQFNPSLSAHPMFPRAPPGSQLAPPIPTSCSCTFFLPL